MQGLGFKPRPLPTKKRVLIYAEIIVIWGHGKKMTWLTIGSVGVWCRLWVFVPYHPQLMFRISLELGCRVSFIPSILFGILSLWMIHFMRNKFYYIIYSLATCMVCDLIVGKWFIQWGNDWDCHFLKIDFKWKIYSCLN